ncbi:DUF1488 domain-containing protein [Pantoea sp. Mb-10]|uniref:DUF1488 domain-containing protein n=1 Tax=unclassified Pantoea TaxID=2630326 RepID=UPI001E59B7A8|nr:MULTISPECIES: DUF1488 domain-containing protein [unclassified Pantoea]MCE0492325.1 DUF1488 domain-containing protein [Pantoea sp. Mb-10]MCE0503667.1 DUF1488 domain-containing protein [Pantoea sp. Pb-8]
MNQAIHFPEREHWDEEQRSVVFPVLVQGAQFTCSVTAAYLRAQYGEGEAMALFDAHRWDLEEGIERLIRQNAIDDQGWIWLC